MPELPDVEIARRNLERWMAGGTIAVARCADEHLLRPGSPRAFARALVGKTVRAVERKGKWLRLELTDGGRLFSHLGMTGDWVHVAIDAPGQRFERARLDVTRKGRTSSVRYLDARRFGRLRVAPDDISEWSSLGPDPLAGGLDEGVLSAAFARSRRAVKEVLMDQTALAGIGNILATEALWIARIDPRSPSAALLPQDVRAVAHGLRQEIARELAERGEGASAGIRKGAPAREGTAGREGNGVFSVYGRAGEPCPRDRATVVQVTLGGRTSAFCKVCQVRRR